MSNRQAVLERLAKRVLDQVGLDRLGDLLLEGRAVLGRLARGLAVDEVLGDQRLRLGRALRCPRPGRRAARSASTSTRAVLSSETSSDSTVPAFTPATFTSEPSTRPKALYISSCVGVRLLVGRDRRREGEAAAASEGDDERDPSHGPVGTCDSVAVDGAAVGERRRAVAGVALGRARAARVVADVEGRRPCRFEDVGRIDRREEVAAARCRGAGREDVERWSSMRPSGAGRVEEARSREAVEPADELRRVGAEVGELRVRVRAARRPSRPARPA